MTSMRKLNRRLARWQRYARRYRPGRWPRNHNVVRCDIRDPRGFVRAHDAWHAEQERRFWDETPEVWLGGPAGEAALIADDYRCCDTGDDGHLGPCVTTCNTCSGDKRCPNCGGVDDLGCGECGGSGSCPDCWGQGEHIEDVYLGPVIRTTTAFQKAGVL